MHENLEKSSVELFQTEDQIAYLVVNVPVPPNQSSDTNRILPKTTYLFTLDKKTGGIYHAGLPRIDLFSDESEAFEFVSKIRNVKKLNIGKVLIGATVDSNQLIILTVDKAEETCRIFNEPIYKILNVNYTQIPLMNNLAKTEPKFKAFDLANCHYYSPTLDLSTVFPYSKFVISTSLFCWNKRFLIPFERNNAIQACVAIYQGGVFALEPKQNSPKNIYYVIKRSVMHSGPRYQARGINSNADPANECECDLIFFNNGKYFCRTWRRGSPPIYWETSPGLFVSHKVKSNPSKDTPAYFSNQIVSRFDIKNIHICSLLHDQGEEKNINDAYEDGVNHISELVPDITVKYKRFDLNHLKETLGEENAIEKLIKYLDKYIQNVGFTIFDTNNDSIIEKQNVMFRFNCADSLDRTNVGTFYFALLTTSYFAKAECNSFKSRNPCVVDKPVSFLNENVIRFLVDSFIAGGHIISMLYTNTSAIKASLISRCVTNYKKSIYSDSMISVWRRIQNNFYDEARQAVLDDWTSTKVKVPKFVLDEQYVTLCPTFNIDEKSIGHSIFEAPQKSFTFSRFEAGKTLLVMFPEPVLVCGISILALKHKPETSLSMTLQIDKDFAHHAPFFCNIVIPTFPNDTWITYNLRKIAKTSSNFPIDPIGLQPTTFLTIDFICNDAKFTCGNIRFIVQRPSFKQTKYEIIENPPKGKPIDQNVKEIYGDCSNDRQNLSTLQTIEAARVENGISDFIRNSYLIQRKQNPWVFDIRSQLIQKFKEVCPLCGSKSSENPPFFIPDAKYSILFQQTDNAQAKNVIFLCQDCQEHLDSNLSYQRNFVSKYHQNLVDINVNTGKHVSLFTFYDQNDIQLSKYARFYLKPSSISSEQLQCCLSPGEEQKCIEICDKVTTFSLCFPSFIMPKTLTILLRNAENFDLSVTIPGSKVNIAKIQNCTETQFKYLLECQRTQTLILTFKAKNPNSDYLIILRKLIIDGTFTYSRSTSKASNDKVGNLPAFKETLGVWNENLRTHTFNISKNPLCGIAVKTPQNPKRANSLIVAFYKGDTYLFYDVILVPEVQDKVDCFYFPINHELNYDNVVIFYLDRLADVEPHKFMFY
ncbi:hypothetical protein TRFO_08875 [Tritrichomonas foetus]|uniref:SAC domain-containing protein n=1 Tax=Tritrichomonas foetus TaxID=1144522 RepID=A0A1J4JHF0_9EUKA|nr:hypothetical protein TRFO_08875 [Tritrichomonas foetus]|eukprot:OHS98578.1 hypothetical protein TRFO_08875 [Tritrichomonas foetus]